MKRALITALVAVLVLPVGAAAQDGRSEIEAPWDETETMTIIETGYTEVAGIPDDQFCRAMAWFLQAEPSDTDVAMCARLIGEFMNEQAWVAETWLPLIFAEAPATVAKPMKVSGKGSKKTKPFMLAEGDYKVTLKKAKGCDQFTYGYLIDAAGDYSPSGEVAQDGYIYGIEEGRHYWEAEADGKCKWTYTLTPLD